MFRTKLLITACALVAFSGPAWAGSTSTSSADSSSTAKSTATSSSNAALNANIGVSNTASTSIQSGNQNQPGGVGVPSPAAANCGGYSGGFALGLASVTIGGSIGTIEENCVKDRHIGIGLSDPVLRPVAEQDWLAMEDELFGRNKQAPAQGASTGGATTQQTAAAPDPACVGMNTKTNWYANNCGGSN